MKFNCDHCDQRLEAADSYAGEAFLCPSCDQQISVPSLPASVDRTSETIRPGVSSLGSFLKSQEPDSEKWQRLISSGALASLDDETRYQTSGELGRGGMGSVMLADDFNLRRSVAMKRLLENRSEPEVIYRFIEEAQVTGQLEHPGIVPVYELGFDSEGKVYYTMKRVDGEPLLAILRRLRKKDAETIAEWPLVRLLRVFVQICEAIAFAHDKKVIHRDLKPENVMIGNYGEVLVVDWGLAKILDQDPPLSEGAESETARVTSVRLEDDSDSMLTLEGSICGTPQYMSPEQASGGTVAVDPRTDVFSLGAVLYEILTLRPPYGGRSVMEILSNAQEGSILQIGSETTQGGSPVTWPERVHVPDGEVPESMAAVALKALSAGRENRYTNVQELKQEVEAFLNGFATGAENASLWRQVKLFWSRNRAACLTGAVALLAIFAVLITSSLVNRAERKKAETARAAADEVIDVMLYDLRDELMKNGLHDLHERVNQTAREYFETFPRDAESDEKVLIQKAAALGTSSDSLMEMGRLADARQAAEEAQAIYENLIQRFPDQIELQQNYGISLQNTGKIIREIEGPEKALPYVERSAVLFETLYQSYPDTRLKRSLTISLQFIGDFKMELEGPAAALPVFEKRLRLNREMAKKDPTSMALLDLANSLHWVGGARLATEGPRAALPEFEEMNQIALDLVGKDPNFRNREMLAQSHEKIGHAVLTLEGPLKAQKHFETCYEITREILEAEPSAANRSLHATSCQWVGLIQQNLRNDEEALRFRKEMKDLLARIHEEEPAPSNAYALAVSQQALGNNYRLLKQSDLALTALEKGHAILLGLYSNHPTAEYQSALTASHSKLGEYRTDVGDLSQALEHYIESGRLISDLTTKSPSAANTRTLAIAHWKLGTTYQALTKSPGDENHSRAIQHVEKGIQCLEKLDETGQLDNQANGWISTFRRRLETLQGE